MDESSKKYRPTYAKKVELTARYVITPIRGGKKLQAVLLYLASGQTWIRAYRPIPDEYQFSDKMVVVSGRPHSESPYVQSIRATHFNVETIALAKDEVPYSPLPTTLPLPPNVKTALEIRERFQLWVNCTGKLLQVRRLNRSHSALIAIEDGTEVSFRFGDWLLHRADFPFGLDAVLGQDITVLGQVQSHDLPQLGLSRVRLGRWASCPVDEVSGGEKK